jgi:hypothetical protein
MPFHAGSQDHRAVLMLRTSRPGAPALAETNAQMEFICITPKSWVPFLFELLRVL